MTTPLFAFQSTRFPVSVKASKGAAGQILLTYRSPKAGTFSLAYPSPDNIETLVSQLDGFYRYGAQNSNDPEKTIQRDTLMDMQATIVNLIGQMVKYGEYNVPVRQGITF